VQTPDRATAQAFERTQTIEHRETGVDLGAAGRHAVSTWNFLGLPLPRFLAPRIAACESAEDGRFNFHVEISHPLTGLIVRYRGWLVPATSPSSPAP